MLSVMLITITAWLVVALHVLFALMESVGWTRMARGFGYDRAATEATRPLALNQGAYNAGLATLLGWALVAGHDAALVALLAYVVAMSVVGALTVRWTIFVVQGLPALVALAIALIG